MTDEQKQEFINTFAPEPEGNRKWDAVFLFDKPLFEDYLAWFWSVFVCNDGELHQEWVNLKRRMLELSS